MSRKFFSRLLVITMILSFCCSMKYLRREHRQNISLLIDFTCATAKDEFEKHPEMRTIAMIEMENNFPSDFSAKVLKCLPPDVAKIIINPHNELRLNNTVRLSKETLIICVKDGMKMWEMSWFYGDSPVAHRVSKHLIISSDHKKINETEYYIFALLNAVQIYEENQKVIARNYDKLKFVDTFDTFESSQQENLSQILFPDKTKNLGGQSIFVGWHESPEAHSYKGSDRPNNKWIPYLDILAEKMNATLKFNEIDLENFNITEYFLNEFFLNYKGRYSQLHSYNNLDICLLAPLPDPYDITDLVLFLPMDKSCWMWLGITIAVSTLIWRISEGHWGFAYGFFSYFMGQGQLVIRIKTNRLLMKILLQLLIFAIFIFSNGYQSIVTSFMLNPKQRKLIKDGYDLMEKIEEELSRDHLFLEIPGYGIDDIIGHKFFVPAVFNGSVGEYQREDDWSRRMVEENFARFEPCKDFKMRSEINGDGKTWNGIYMSNDKSFTKTEDLAIIDWESFLDKYQELMDQSFQAGLHQAWERFFWEIWRSENKRSPAEEENDLLDLNLIAPFFLILAYGFCASFLGLLGEIFWKDFVSQLSKEYFKRKWKEICGKKKKFRKGKTEVRVIQGKPATIRRRHSI